MTNTERRLPALAVHGGAWDWSDDLDAGKAAGIEEALDAGWAVLAADGTAVDAVEAAVRSLEDNPVFDAGYGGYLNQDGVVQLDALLAVDGDFGSVAGVTRVSNPVSLARRVLEDVPECFFVGEGADRLAEHFGLADAAGTSLVTDAMQAFFDDRRTDGPRDTVGAVAIDVSGQLAAAASTSGTPYKPAGRVGDTAIFGAGGYAATGVAAVATTGLGEQIYRSLLAKYTADCVSLGMSSAEAAHFGAQHFEAAFPQSMSGLIIVDRLGQVSASQTAPKMAHGWVSADGQRMVAMRS